MGPSFNYFNFVTEKSYQFGMVAGSKYYDTREPRPLLLWRRGQSEAQIRAAASSKGFFVAVVSKTRRHSYQIHPKFTQCLTVKCVTSFLKSVIISSHPSSAAHFAHSAWLFLIKKHLENRCCLDVTTVITTIL